MLLKAGADVNNALMYGRTPLHLAAAGGNDKVMALLLQHGADPQRRDCSGSSAFDVACRYGHALAVKVLKPSLGLEGNSFQPHIPNTFLSPDDSLNLPATIPYRPAPAIEAQLQAEVKKDQAVFRLAVQDHCDALAAYEPDNKVETTTQNGFHYFDWEHF